MTDELARPAVFDPSVLARLLEHLNRCHRVENLVLARHAYAERGSQHDSGTVPAPADGVQRQSPVRQAWIAGLDGHGVDLLGETPNGPTVLRLTFGWPACTLAAVGEELRHMYRIACRSSR